MTDAGELDPELSKLRKLREFLPRIVRISSALNHSKKNKAFTGWVVRLCDIDHDGPVERAMSVFGSHLRVSESNHDAELVLTDDKGQAIIVLPCSSLDHIEMPPRRNKMHHYNIRTESGATIVLAA